jgi:hypothetical protein
MANLDTAAKRGSGIAVGSPWRARLPLPDGTVAQGDRQAVALMYSGIAALAAAPVTTAPVFEGLRRNVGRMIR